MKNRKKKRGKAEDSVESFGTWQEWKIRIGSFGKRLRSGRWR